MADNLLAQIVRQLTRKTGAPSTTFARTGIVTPRRDMVDRSGDNPQYQDVTIGEETPTPRTGVTLDQMARVPTGVFRPASPEQESSPANILFQKIQELQGKDYSKTKNESGETVYGKDYDKTHNIKDIFRGIGLGVLTNIANAKIDYSNPNVNPLAQVLGAGLGGAAGGGIGAGINRNADNKMLDQIKIAQMVPQYNQAYGIEQQKIQGDLATQEKEARIADIPLEREYKNDVLEQRRKEAAARRVTTAQNKLYSGKVFDPLNPAHRAIAKTAGLNPDEMRGWDFSNPVKVTVNGQTFDYDRVSGAWKPSGLPQSEKDKLIEFEVAVPGEKNLDGTQKIRKFMIPQEKAAGFSKDLQAAGMQIEAADKRLVSSQRFELQKMEIAQKLKKELDDYDAAIAEAKAEKDEARRKAAEERAEASRKRIIEYQKSLSVTNTPDF